MSGSEIVTLAAALVALLGSILSLYVATRLALRKERRQLLWSKEWDRLLVLEELAGDLVEEVGSHHGIPENTTALARRFDSLERAAGRFGRYPEVRQACRDLHNALARMFDGKREHEDVRNIRKELEPAFRNLLTACDRVIGRQRV